MPVTLPRPSVVVGLVLTLLPDRADPPSLLAALANTPRLRLGPRSGAWLPLSAESDDPEGLHDWLSSLPGVAAVDVTFVEIVPEPTPAASSAAAD